MFEPAFEPRHWQRDALTAWIQADRRGIVEVATGAGKTNLGLLAAHDVLASDLARRVYILVPTIALLDQWYVSIGEDLGVPAAEIEVWGGGHEPGPVRLFNLMVINTAREQLAALPDLPKSLLIVDECHRAGSVVNSHALEGKFAATLGMSATPDNQYDRRLDEVLRPYLGEVIYRYSLIDAYKDGILSPFTLINVSIELDQEEKEAYAELTRKAHIALHSKRISDDERNRRLRVVLRRRASVSNHAHLRSPVAVKLVESHRGERCLVFNEYIGEAERIAQMLKERGHSVALYHSQIGDGLRHDNLRLFRRGSFDILVTCRALDEGLNIPEVRVAIIAASTATERQRIQRLGRVLRPARGKERAVVYTIYATSAEERRLVKEAKIMGDQAEILWHRAGLPARG